MSIRLQIRDACIALLNDQPPNGVPETTKRRFVPGEKLIEPRLAAFFGEEEAHLIGGTGGALTKRPLIIAIQAMNGVENPDEADDSIEPMLVHIVNRLGQTNLGGLATKVEEIGTLWASSTSDAGRFYLIALTRWRVEYQTRRDDLTRKQ